jgi:hypothetical protein
MKVAALAMFAWVLAAESAGIQIGGVELQVGMPKDAALAKLAVAPHSRLQEIATDSYQFLTQGRSGWSSIGDVVFRRDVLTRVCLYASPDAPRSVVQALYDALHSKAEEENPRVWVEVDPGPVPPIKEIHIAYADREVVLSTLISDGKDVTMVRVFFPKMLTSK